MSSDECPHLVFVPGITQQMSSRVLLSEEDLHCPVCHKVFKDPVVLSCSHSFCTSCLKDWWKVDEMHQCPVCKRRSSKSEPPKNLVLKNLCEAFSQQRAQRSLAGSEEVCSLHSEKLQLFCLDHQQTICLVCLHSEEHTNHSFRPIDEAAQRHKAEALKSLEPLKEKLSVLQKAKGEWAQSEENTKVQAQETEKQINEEFNKLQKVLQEEQKARIYSLRQDMDIMTQIVKEKIEGLSKEIEDVSDSIRAVEKQLEAPDVSFLQNYKATLERAHLSLPQWPSGALTDVTKHLEKLKLVSQMHLHLQRSARTERLDLRQWKLTWTSLRRYGSKLTLDLNTVNYRLSLSEDNRKVTRGENQSYPDHPDRFTSYPQVLCREGLTGRCYWEVDWRGWVYIGVTYRGISRGGGDDSCLGCNDKSWVLECDNGYTVLSDDDDDKEDNDDNKGYTARHNNIPTPIYLSSSVSNRVGVYVDRPAGSLSFYTVSSDTLTHIHTFYCTFTGELLAGFRVGYGSSVSLCQIE